MNIFIKIHKQFDGQSVIAIADEDLLGRELLLKNLKINISPRFYKGKIATIDEGIKLLKNSSNFNIIGKEIVKKAIECGIISEEAVIMLNDIPHAIKFKF